MSTKGSGSERAWLDSLSRRIRRSAPEQVASALHPAVELGGAIPRRRLVASLQQSPARVRSIVAPPGSGKTIAAMQYSAALRDAQTVWVDVSAVGAQDMSLWGVLAAGLGAAIPRSVKSDAGDSDVVSVLDQLRSTHQPIHIVFDGLEALGRGVPLEELQEFVATMPHTATVTLIGTGSVPARLARAKLTDDVFELSAAELWFDHIECAAAIGAATHRRSLPTRVHAVMAATDGWPALVDLAMHDLAPADTLSRSHSEPLADPAQRLADRMLDELGGSSGSLRAAPLVPSLTPLAIEHLFGVADGQAALEEMRRLGMFGLTRSVPASGAQLPCLRDLLVAHLAVTMPAVEVSRTRRAAAHWFRHSGDVLNEARVGAENDDWFDARDALERYVHSDGAVLDELLRWIERLPDWCLRTSPVLVAVAQPAAHLSALHEMADRLDLATVAGRAGPSDDGWAHRLLECWRAWRVADTTALAASLGRLAVADAPPIVAGLDVFMTAVRALSLGDRAGAVATANRSAATGASVSGTYAALVQPLRAGLTGSVRDLPPPGNDAWGLAEHSGLGAWVGAAGLAQRGESDRVDASLERAAELAMGTSSPLWWFVIEFARIDLATNEGVGSRAGEIAQRVHQELANYPRSDELRARLRRYPSDEVGRAVAADSIDLTNRERQIAELLGSPMTLSQLAMHLEISPNTLKTHLRSLYRKLGASDRDAAYRLYRSVRPTRGEPIPQRFLN
ncbi:MAG: LuxR C-terminal-related transcriptional regulator [Actinomycetota bacterium]